MPRRVPTGGLFVQISGAVGLTVILTLGVNATLTTLAGRGPLREVLHQNLELHAIAAISRVAQHVENRAHELSVWANLDVFDEILVGDPAFRVENVLLELLRNRGRDYSMLSVLDARGTVVASTDPSQIGSLRTIEGQRLVSAGESGLHVGPYPVRGGPEGHLVLAQPIVSRLRRERIGWLVGHVRWDTVADLVETLNSAYRPDEHTVIVADEAGNVLAASGPEAEAVDSSLVARIPPGGIQNVPLGRPDSHIAVGASTSLEPEFPAPPIRAVVLWEAPEAYSLVRTFVLTVAGTAMFGTLFALGTSFAVARHIARRVRTVTHGTERIAQGDLEHRVSDARRDELGRLAHSFNLMADRILKSRAAISAGAARWRSVVENAPDVIATLDLEGKIVFINRTESGAPIKDVLETSIFDRIQPRSREPLREALRKVRETLLPTSIELEAPGDGSRSPRYSARVGPILQNARVVGFTLIATDITEARRLERELIDATEAERKRIGRELHDGLGQILTGISLLATGLHNDLAAQKRREESDARQISALAQDAIEQVRRAARGLFPVSLERAGLTGALEELASSVDGLRGVACAFESAGSVPQVDRTTELHLFRIAQEAVTNALRHAKACRIKITLSFLEGSLRVLVEDDGIGLPSEPDRGQSMGLRLMRYRASMIGASLLVSQGEARGTRVECRL